MHFQFELHICRYYTWWASHLRNWCCISTAIREALKISTHKRSKCFKKSGSFSCCCCTFYSTVGIGSEHLKFFCLMPWSLFIDISDSLMAFDIFGNTISTIVGNEMILCEYISNDVSNSIQRRCILLPRCCLHAAITSASQPFCLLYTRIIIKGDGRTEDSVEVNSIRHLLLSKLMKFYILDMYLLAYITCTSVIRVCKPLRICDANISILLIRGDDIMYILHISTLPSYLSSIFH